jgi:hypothetical protein
MNAKKAMLAIVVVFMGFWMFTDPHGMANAAKGAGSQTWALATQLFQALIDFFGALS